MTKLEEKKIQPKQDFPQNDTSLQGLKLALESLNKLQKKNQKQGFSRPAFTIGLLNMGVTVYIVCIYPEYYWIVFLSKLLMLLPTRLFLGCKSRDNYYLLDFCWVSCISVFMVFILTATGVFTPQITRQAMRILFTFSCGPQGWSIILFSNSLVFHSIMHTASVFIHLTPVILCYTIRWNLDKLSDTFPSLFPLDESLLTDNLIGDLYLPALLAYLCWFVIYAIWLAFHGLSLPSKGQDTVFNWLYTTKKEFSQSLDTIAYKIGGQERNQQTKGKVLIFMCIHLVQANILMFWALLCYEYEIIHLLFIFVLAVSVIWKSSGYYLYISIKAPKKEIEKLIKQVENNDIVQVIDDIENQKQKENISQEPQNRENRDTVANIGQLEPALVQVDSQNISRE